MPKPPLQGATATTAASGGNREELLGPRPAGCERQRSRRWVPQPGQWHGVSRDGEVGRRERLWQAGRRKTPFRRLLLREGRGIWPTDIFQSLIRSNIHLAKMTK